MTKETIHARTRKRVWLFIGFVALVVVVWRPLSLSSSPKGLMEVTLGLYERAPHLDPFDFNGPTFMPRLVGLTTDEARAALNQCPVRKWKHLGTGDKDYVDDPLYHHWECTVGSIRVRAREMWEPHMGTDGVYFSACRQPRCPDFEASFDNGFYHQTFASPPELSQ